jgi:Zn-dependent membrane protease YugP
VYLDIHHLLYITLPLVVIMGACQLWVRSAYAKYSKIGNAAGVTGAEAAKIILRSAGIDGVRIEPVQGWLSDHYSPKEKVLRLSPENYSGTSIAAVGIAAHESGHAIQDAQRYAPLVIRNIAVPAASIGSTFGWIAVVIGASMSAAGQISIIAWLGLLLLGAVVFFQLINLPVEFDASRRALQVLPATGILTAEENEGARSVLTAAAMTYVAATVAAIAELLYWAWRLGLLGGSNNRD